MFSIISWTLTGTAAFAAWQWCLLVIVARNGSAEEVGALATALSIVTPVFVLAGMSLRQIISADTKFERSNIVYWQSRVWCSVAALIACAVLSLVNGHKAVAVFVLSCATLKFSEALSDVLYGMRQRESEEASIGKSQTVRAILLAITFWIVVAMSIHASVALAVCAILSLLLIPYLDVPADMRRAALSIAWTDRATGTELLSKALPAGLAASIIALGANLPRLQLDAYNGAITVGQFALLMSVFIPGHLLFNAMMQLQVGRIAKDIDRVRIARLAVLLGGFGLAATATAFLPFAIEVALNSSVIEVIYGGLHKLPQELTWWAFVANAVVGLASIANYAAVASRLTQFQFFAAIAALLTGLLAGPTLIELYGLTGALLTVVAMGLMQLSLCMAAVIKRLLGHDRTALST